MTLEKTNTIRSLLENREKKRRQLKNLEKELKKRKISDAIGNKLRKELETDLQLTKEKLITVLTNNFVKITDRLNTLKDNIETLTEDHEECSKKLEENKARFKIRQIDRGQYNQNKKLVEREQQITGKKISENKVKIKRLSVLLEKTKQMLQLEKKEES